MRGPGARLLGILAGMSVAIVTVMNVLHIWPYWFLIPVELLLCFLGLLVCWALPCLVGLCFIDKNKPMERHSRFFSYYARQIVSLMLIILRVQLRVSGIEKLPQERFLLVGNHRSFLDPVVEIGVFQKQRVSFVAKQELFEIPVVGRLIHSLQCLSLHRGAIKEELKTILQATKLVKDQSASIGIYPEGTRNSKPGLLPFKNGAFRIAEKAKAPIAVAVIHNSDQVKRNFPFRGTKVRLELVGVLDKEFVQTHNSTQISEKVRSMMEQSLLQPATV
ncbi:MAG: 1-acyl-sn-glycerol-3-phosphate acyltransferase [Oscillospiraceae bacterium]|nr:1-acyl-sn-glycerol-3-phosphate acyltransferase [Oscillospiraceae bacterium]